MKRLIAALMMVASVSIADDVTNAVPTFLYAETVTNYTIRPNNGQCLSCSTISDNRADNNPRTVEKQVIRRRWFRITSDDGVSTQAFDKVLITVTNTMERAWRVVP